MIENLSLSDQDRKLLKDKRGFTDETISLLKFRSTCNDEDALVKKLRETFTLSDLIASGIIEKGKLAWSLTKPEMMIVPYLDGTGKTSYFIKSHKNGNLKGIEVEPYAKFIFDKVTSDTVVLCESEFKAAAMFQMGFRALGLGGVATFAGDNVAKLKTFLDRVQKIVILFDAETQDNPAFQNFKDHFKKMYAQHIWAYRLAVKIEYDLREEGKDKSKWDIKIATLPEEWMIEGKIDIDGAIAAGHTKDEFTEIIQSAVNPTTYRNTMKVPQKHRPWVIRQMEKAFRNEYVTIKNGCYSVHRKQGGDTEISNFVMKIKNTLFRQEQVYRETVLISKFEDVSRTFILAAEDFSTIHAFREVCLSKGDFSWRGTELEWQLLIEDMFLDNDTIPIHLLEFTGRDEENKQWIFENVLLKDNGKVITVSEDGSTFFDDEKGYRIVPLLATMLPKLSFDPFSVEEVFRKFEEAWGTTGVMGFAFAIASLFSNKIFDEYKAFPFAMIYGEKEAGKTTFSDAMVMMFGFTPHYTNLSISDTTVVGMGRALGYYTSLPLRFDEYRKGEKKVEDKSSFMRSVYNRQGSLKGKREEFGVRQVKSTSTVIIIGEQRPDDPALLSRMIPLYLTPTKKSDKSYQAVKWFYENQTRISNVTLQILKRYNELSKKLIFDLNDTRKSLGDLPDVQSSFRVQFHFALILSALALVLGEEVVGKYIAPIKEKFYETVHEQTETAILSKFFAGLLTMKHMNEPVTDYLTLDREDRRHGIIYFPGLYNIFSKFEAIHGRRLNGLFEQTTLKQYFGSQPYMLQERCKKQVPASKGTYARCHKIDISHPSVSAYLKELFEGVTYYEPARSVGSTEPDNEGS